MENNKNNEKKVKMGTDKTPNGDSNSPEDSTQAITEDLEGRLNNYFVNCKLQEFNLHFQNLRVFLMKSTALTLIQTHWNRTLITSKIN